jgi:hypothetical protein
VEGAVQPRSLLEAPPKRPPQAPGFNRTLITLLPFCMQQVLPRPALPGGLMAIHPYELWSAVHRGDSDEVSIILSHCPDSIVHMKDLDGRTPR